ncbi:hypothetical protein [Duganella fentianensis]
MLAQQLVQGPERQRRLELVPEQQLQELVLERQRLAQQQRLVQRLAWQLV